MFEHVLLAVFGNYIISDELQFGFKKDTSCSHAILIVRVVTKYFNDRNSNVFIASLDATKAFDRVNHRKLDVLFNHKKSFCIAIGRDYHSGHACLDLSGHKLQWVISVKYLGVVIVSGPTFSMISAAGNFTVH